MIDHELKDFLINHIESGVVDLCIQQLPELWKRVLLEHFDQELLSFLVLPHLRFLDVPRRGRDKDLFLNRDGH